MTSKGYRFRTSCVNAKGVDINAMKDAAKQVTRRTFMRYVNKEDLKQIEKDLSYNKGFHMSNDWHVAYYLSTYRKTTCAYFVHSAIEYVFVEVS